MIQGLIFAFIVGVIAIFYSPGDISQMPWLMLVLACSLGIFNINEFIFKSRKRWPYAVGFISSVRPIKTFWGSFVYEIGYTYRVSDRDHHGLRFDFWQPYATKANISSRPEFDFISDPLLLKGKMVRVIYNRSSPWDSALSSSAKRGYYIVLLPSCCIILFCLVSLFGLFFDDIKQFISQSFLISVIFK